MWWNLQLCQQLQLIHKHERKSGWQNSRPTVHSRGHAPCGAMSPIWLCRRWDKRDRCRQTDPPHTHEGTQTDREWRETATGAENRISLFFPSSISWRVPSYTHYTYKTEVQRAGHLNDNIFSENFILALQLSQGQSCPAMTTEPAAWGSEVISLQHGPLYNNYQHSFCQINHWIWNTQRLMQLLPEEQWNRNGTHIKEQIKKHAICFRFS